MAIRRSTDAAGLTVTFALDAEQSLDPVSVVGSFNDWTPGATPFEADADRSRSATIVVPAGTDVYFRYLGPDGVWFDDPDADEITADGSVLRAPEPTPTEPEPAPEPEPALAQETEPEPESASESAPEPEPEPAPQVEAESAPEPETALQPDQDEATAPDDTGERLETVADLISEAKHAAHDLADRDIIDVESVDQPEADAEQHGQQPG